MLLVLLTWLGLHAQATKSAENVFEFRTLQIIKEIEKRMRDHALVLLGGAGLFTASDSVEPHEWHAYVDRLQLPLHFPGILGVGYSVIVKPADLQAHIAAVRAQGFPGFTVHPAGKRELYSSIIYLEPFAGRNLAAFGYDMLSEPTRAKAMRLAAESGNPVISGKVTLVQENEGPMQAGFLMYLPIYHEHLPLKTAADRWAALKGFVYSPYRMNNLMQGILGKQKFDIGFAIYDGLEVSDDTRMYASNEGDDAPPAFSTERLIESYSHTWRVKLYSQPHFAENLEFSYTREALILETVMVLLLAGLTFNINSGRERARELVLKISQREREVHDLNTNLEQQVHDRTTALDALRNKEEEISAIVNTVFDGIITIDDKGTVCTFNPAAGRIFGYDAEEVVGQNVKMLMPEPHHGKHDDYLGNYLRTGEAKVIGIGRELTGRRKDGSTFPMEAAVTEMSTADERKFTGIIRDITERKNFINELEQARSDAEYANRAKSQFLASMSHEIRTPLNGVIGNLELLTLSELGDEQLAMLDDAQKAAKSLLSLIGNILDFSKIEAGKIVYETKDIDIAELLQDTLDVLQTTARLKNTFVVSTVTADVPKVVRCDGVRIRQILLNLIGNAVKFTDVGGVLVDLSVTAQDQNMCELRFTVSDSGKGFDQSHADRLFKPFTQDGSDSAENEGTGLGLSISRILVENFGGSIGCESEPGEGATFWFTMPVIAVSRATPPAKPDLSGRTVMMVGGSGGTERWLEDYFKTRGADVESVRDIPDDISAIAQERSRKETGFDVVILISDNVQVLSQETVRQLRTRHMVPLLHGPQTSYRNFRLALQTGFAALLPKEPNIEFLDRNIRMLFGHALQYVRRNEEKIGSLAFENKALQRKRVLVLEDRPINQNIIQKQLLKLGVVCTLALNGIEGLEALEHGSFDLILCDCSMPEMDGYDFTRTLRRNEKEADDGRHLPVIALTANAFREDQEKCFEAGMDDFISKPVTLGHIALALNTWLGPRQPALNGEDRRRTDFADKTPAIDMNLLVEILGTNERTEIDQILAGFLPAARASLKDVKAALLTSNAEKIAAAAHGAKGEAQSAAAVELAKLYEEMERRAKGGDLKELQGLGAGAVVEVRRIEDFFRREAKGSTA